MPMPIPLATLAAINSQPLVPELCRGADGKNIAASMIIFRRPKRLVRAPPMVAPTTHHQNGTDDNFLHGGRQRKLIFNEQYGPEMTPVS